MVSQDDSRKTWTVTLQNGSKGTFDANVVCTGMYSSASPLLPSFPGRDEFEGSGGKVMHSSEFLDSSLAKGNRVVVVVGGGKSATDITMW